MSSPANPHESSILGICSICSYEASGEPYLGPPRGAEQRGRVAATPPGLRPAPRALLRVGHAAPGSPVAALPVRSRARAPAICRPKGGGALGCFGWKFSKKAPQARATGGWANRRFVHAEGVSLSPITHALRRAVHTLVVWAGELSRRGKAGPMHPIDGL